MNTYNESLQQTVSNTLDALSAQQAQLASTRIAAEYTLYYAQGAELTARDNLEDTRALVVFSQQVNDQSLFNSNQAYNLQASLTQANLDVAASVTNAATAAANVQIASNAIAALAADIGATLNVATASLFGDDSYRKIQDANSFVNEVANNAKAIALGAMNASTKTSEIIAASVLNQGNTVKTKVNALYSATTATLSTYSDQALSEQQTVAQASKSGRQAEGATRDARREADAITRAFDSANAHLNMGLKVAVVSGKAITVSFNALSSPLPTFSAAPASAIRIPPALPQYYLALVREDAQTMFTVDQAEQLFMQMPDQSKQFLAVQPGDAGNAVPLSVDVYGADIVPGVGYVGFLLIVLSKEYQRFVNNYSDLLSAPSPTFVPATLLPKAEAWAPVNPPPCPAQAAAVMPPLYFKAAPIAGDSGNAAKHLEFRCILVEEGKQPKLGFMTAAENDYKEPIYFNLAIARQVAPSNYVVAEPVEPADAGAPKADAAADTVPAAEVKPAADHYYRVCFTPATTDNFGNLVREDAIYHPYILAIVDDVSAGQYTPVLTNSLAQFTATFSRSANNA